MADPHVLQDILHDLHRPGDFPVQSNPYKLQQLYHRWPIVVYRTGYTAGSDRNWEALTTKIQSEIVQKINEAAIPYSFNGETRATDEETAKYEEEAQNLLELLDFRAISDAATLDGASHDKLRDLYQALLQQEGLADTIQCQRPFFVADAEVLADDLKWMKCLDTLYDAHPEWYIDRDPQRYFGWMKMVTHGVVELYSDMFGFEMHELAPKTIGGMHLVTWEPK